MLDDARFRTLIDNRARHPERIAELARARRRRPMLREEGTLFLVAADHPARGVLKAGDRPLAMADRRSLLERILIALSDPGIDDFRNELLWSPDAPNLIEVQKRSCR